MKKMEEELRIEQNILFTLKQNWGQSNNFYLKWSFFVIKQNNNKNFQKFTWSHN